MVWRWFLSSVAERWACDKWPQGRQLAEAWWFATCHTASFIRILTIWANCRIPWVWPLPRIPVTTRIITFVVGNPELNLYLPLGRGHTQRIPSCKTNKHILTHQKGTFESMILLTCLVGIWTRSLEKLIPNTFSTCFPYNHHVVLWPITMTVEFPRKK